MKESRIGYYFIVAASIIVVLAGLKSAAVIVVPILLSLFLAIVLSPLYNFFNNKGVPNGISLSLVMGLFLLLLFLVAKLIGSSAQNFSANIDFYTGQLSVYYLSITEFANSMGIEVSVDDLSTLINTKQAMGFASSLLKSMGSMFSNGFVILLTVIFMMLESQHFIQKISYSSKDSDTLEHVVKISSQIQEYMVLKALISLLTGFIIWVALTIIGTDYAFLWAVLAFMLNFIPNIGSIIAAVPVVLLTLVQLGSLSAIVVTVLYVIVNVVIGSIIEPKIMGKGLGLSTLIVFISLIFWGWLLGIVGMLLSIPLTIMVKIILAANKNTEWIAVLLGTGEYIPDINK